MDIKRPAILQAMITHTLKVVLLGFDPSPHFLSFSSPSSFSVSWSILDVLILFFCFQVPDFSSTKFNKANPMLSPVCHLFL